jgi:hypothetical protein
MNQNILEPLLSVMVIALLILEGKNSYIAEFYVLLTVHLGSILVNDQLDAQFFFCVYLFLFSTCVEHPRAHHQKNQLY